VPDHSFLPLRRVRSLADPFALRVTRVAEDNARGDFVLYHARNARRAQANLALNYAIHLADERGLPVVFDEAFDEPKLNTRTAAFLRDGIAANARDAAARGLGYAFGDVQSLARRARLVVTDEVTVDRLPPWAHITVDHNGMLPLRAFAKEQYSARFLRDRAHKLFPELWTTIDEVAPRVPWQGGALPIDAEIAGLEEVSVAPITGGRDAAMARLDAFVAGGLDGYATKRNKDPRHTSGASPFLHFGHLGIHEFAQRILHSGAPAEDIDSLLEEAIIRRELSLNMCFYNHDYASLKALPDWAKKTLDAHRRDRRKPSYSLEELEAAETYDEVWNHAHQQLLETGTMHGYLRMLWGKKIIEWSDTPEEAHAAMIHLHNKYALDGRDPNTHAGVLWCFGKHDRPWPHERPIFGTIRWMSSEQTAQKMGLRGQLGL
jgi:deoxyribodipyrimidine photo-lyase